MKPAFIPILILILILLPILVTVSPREAGSVEIVDDLGRTVSMDRPAQRIVPLYGAFAEMLYVIGAGSRVVGRTQADRFPEGIERLPSVGTHMRPNLEVILGLKPDLVIQSASRRGAQEELDRLRDGSVPVAVFDPTSFEGIFSVMHRLGILVGREKSADEEVSRLEKRLRAVRERVSDVTTRRKVFFEVRAQPLTGAGRGSIVEDLLLAAGAENSLASDRAMVQYGFEQLLLDDPDVYIVQEGPMNRNPTPPEKRAHYDRLRSVREGNVFFVDELVYSRPGPRCVDAVEDLAARLYPERFKGP